MPNIKVSNENLHNIRCLQGYLQMQDGEKHSQDDTISYLLSLFIKSAMAKGDLVYLQFKKKKEKG